MLQAETLRVRFLTWSLDFSSYLILPATLWHVILFRFYFTSRLQVMSGTMNKHGLRTDLKIPTTLFEHTQVFLQCQYQNADNNESTVLYKKSMQCLFVKREKWWL
jgi:hypothetical protein